MYIVLSGDSGKTPAIVQAFSAKRNAEKAAEKRRKFWEAVKVVKLEDETQIPSETMKTL